MKKTLNLKVGDPVTCMRRYYRGYPHHGKVEEITITGDIVLSFDDGKFTFKSNGSFEPGSPCSIIPGHITPEPLTLPETVEFETGDRVLGWESGGIKMHGIYICFDGLYHNIRLSSGIIYACDFVEPFTEAALWAQFPENENEQPTQPEQTAPVEPDETLKEGDWCLFWDDSSIFILNKYGELTKKRNQPHRDSRGLNWKHARKLKPSDLSPELWAIIKNEEK